MLQQWLELQPSVDAAVALAGVLESTGRTKEARARYEDIVANNPGAAKAASRLAARYVEDGERLEEALSLATRAKQQLQNDPAVSDTLGWISVKRHRPRLGIPHLEDAVRDAPANPVYRYHLGFAYHDAGRTEQARRELTAALGIARNFPGAGAQRTLDVLRSR